MPRLARPLTLLLALAAALLAADGAAEAGSAQTEDGHLVRWDDGLDTIGARAVRMLPEIDRQVAVGLGFPLRGGPAEVILVRGLARMRAEARVNVPEWAGGVCIGARSRIVLRIDLVNDEPGRSMITTLRHEWVHLAWSRRSGKHVRRLPLWLEEGLAEEIGGGISATGGFELDFAAKFGWLIPFSEIETHWPRDGGKAALAYRQGRSWVQFFRDRSGWEALQKILADLADGKGEKRGPGAGSPFEELVFLHSDSTVSHWNASWRHHTKEQAAPIVKLVLRDFMGTILFGTSLIAVVAFFFIRRRRKRQMAELPDD